MLGGSDRCEVFFALVRRSGDGRCDDPGPPPNSRGGPPESIGSPPRPVDGQAERRACGLFGFTRPSGQGKCRAMGRWVHAAGAWAARVSTERQNIAAVLVDEFALD